MSLDGYFLSLLLVWLCSFTPAHAQTQEEVDRLDALVGNIDLPDLGNGDQGQPLKRCKDIWTICGLWSEDREPWKRPCCRSEGPNRVMACRHPSTNLKEWAAGVENFHKTFCLPRSTEQTHWSRSSYKSMAGSRSSSSLRGDTGLLANQEIVEQLTRIADAVERASHRG